MVPSLRRSALQNTVAGRVATVIISPNEVTILHLRTEFESSIRMPEEITSVILSSPGSFKAEHSEGEPDYVYVKPTTKEGAAEQCQLRTAETPCRTAPDSRLGCSLRSSSDCTLASTVRTSLRRILPMPAHSRKLVGLFPGRANLAWGSQ